MINILHVVSGSVEAGGVEEMIYLLCKHLPPEDFSHSIWAPFGTGSYLGRIESENLLESYSETSHPEAFLEFLSENHFDLAVIHSGALNPLFAKPQIGAVSSINNLPVMEIMHRAIPSWAHQYRVDRIIAVSNYVLSLQPPQCSNIVELIRNGIDLSPYQSTKYRQSDCRDLFGIPRNSTVVGFLGRLTEEKGVSDILSAAPTISEAINDTCFLFGGDGPERKKLEQSARKHGINAFFPGEIPPEHKIAFLRSMDIVILPSKTEAFCLVALEAMGAGVPLIAYNLGAIQEFFTGLPDSYFLVSEGDINALGTAAIKVLSTPGERQRLSKYGIKKARQFTIQKASEKYENSIRQVIKSQISKPIYTISSSLYRYLGNIHLLRNEKRDAELCFNTAIRHNPDLLQSIQSDIAEFDEYVRQYMAFLASRKH